MGIQALEGNGITLKLLFLARDKNLTSGSDPLMRIDRRSAIWVFVALELVGFGATFAITQTIAAIGFPVFILLYIPMRTWGLPRWFTEQELRILDAPTASPFTMESVGGNHGEVVEEETSGDDVLDESDEAERGERQLSRHESVVQEGKLNAEGASRRRSSFRTAEGFELDNIEKS